MLECWPPAHRAYGSARILGLSVHRIENLHDSWDRNIIYTQRHNSLSIFGRIVDIKPVKKREDP